MNLPATGSYQIARPSEIPAVNWNKADAPNGFSSSSIKAAWESGDYHEIHGYIIIADPSITGSEATRSALDIQNTLDDFCKIASHSGYNMSGSLLWKDNEAHHPFS
jgi:hypothetical protein|tara:strand:+ start:7593 stop:7910 length:318 start_codon:yes stop_codon:yes gene_type:complete